MAHITIPTDADASPDQAIVFEHSKKMFGRVANAVRVASHTPKLAQSIFSFIVAGLREEITQNLPVRTKALVILKTSTLNGCAYWTSHNVTLGRALDFSDDLIEAIKGDYLGSEFFTAAEKAAMHWAEVLTLKQYHGTPGKPPKSEEVMATLKEYYDEAQIVELTMVCGFFNFWNRFTDGLQIDIEDDPTMNLFTKSTTVEPVDYVTYMRECWWNEPR